MQVELVEVLPYRTDPEQLARWVEVRARGRASAQLREMDLAPKTLEGTLATAAALGLLDRDTQELTPTGQRFALASDTERRTLLRSALRAFPPFGRLLQAVADREPRAVTDAAWIETWWATHGYGSSQSNRMEATAVFGRLVEYVGWGRYIPGRRGHPTRIEWTEDAFPATSSPGVSPDRTSSQRDAAVAALPPRPTAPTSATAPAGAVAAPAPVQPAANTSQENVGRYNRIVVPLRSGEVARLEVPQRLPREEKRRLVELLELLITVEDA